VVDLDASVFEVFGKGERKDETVSKRFLNVGKEKDPVPRFIKSFDLDKLPASKEDFINALNLSKYEVVQESEENEERYVKVEVEQDEDEAKDGEDDEDGEEGEESEESEGWDFSETHFSLHGFVYLLRFY
jgi:hypothetical protein